jgi:hypothetical protein
MDLQSRIQTKDLKVLKSNMGGDRLEGIEAEMKLLDKRRAYNPELIEKFIRDTLTVIWPCKKNEQNKDTEQGIRIQI